MGARCAIKGLHCIIDKNIIPDNRERSGSVVQCLTRDLGPWVRASPASLRCGP